MKKILLEKLGIPEGIEKQADVLYQGVIDKLNEIVISKDLDEPIEIGRFNIEIKDLKFNNIPFVLFLNVIPDIDKPILVSLGCVKGAKFITSNNKLKFLRDISTAHFRITLAVPNDVKKDNIVEYIKKKLEVSSIAHELMHFYDAYKNESENIIKHAEYISYQKMMGLSPDIVDFMYLMYYMSAVENTVRPSELYSKLLKDEVSKDNFLEYMKSSDIMKTVERARTFSLEKLREKINNDENLKKLVKEAIATEGYESIGDTADDVLNIVLITIAHNSLSFMNSVFSQYVSDGLFDFIRGMLGCSKSDAQKEKEEIAQKTMEEITNSYKKYVNKPKKYFEKLEKSLNFAGEKMKRKLYKLYDMVKDSTKTKSDSVLNWDLHTKISSKKNEGIKYVLNFDDFKLKIGKK